TGVVARVPREIPLVSYRYMPCSARPPPDRRLKGARPHAYAPGLRRRPRCPLRWFTRAGGLLRVRQAPAGTERLRATRLLVPGRPDHSVPPELHHRAALYGQLLPVPALRRPPPLPPARRQHLDRRGTGARPGRLRLREPECDPATENADPRQAPEEAPL